MVTRNDILLEAANKCMKDLYSLVTPKVKWDDFVQECKEYSAKYKDWEKNKDSERWAYFKDKSITECIGPRPYEFYYLPKEIMKDICDSYIYAYKIDSQKELLDNIEILKSYCKEPIVNKYIDDWTDETGFHHPGYRSYDRPNNLEKELQTKLREKAGFSVTNTGIENLSKELQDKFFEFLDMAGNFFNWNRDLNSFNITVYLGASPNSNKEAVIENWKKYRGKDIEINEEQIKKDYYGDNDE